MAESSTTTSNSDAQSPDFGANEWLVEEMYERFASDPSSVDSQWADFFRQGNYAGEQNGAASNGAAAKPDSVAEKAAASPTPTTQPADKTASGERAQTRVPDKDTAATPPAAKSTEPKATPTKKSGTPKAAPAAAQQPQGPGEVEKVVLKGAAARTATNMDQSLSVPTATSVRSVPVKLLFDNRIVINNHLARARGGKVSFTHLIGFAVVQAIKAMPEMNIGFEHNDKGKPVQLKPEHINFGLAIDLPKPDGTRQLLVPSIKAAETMDFAQFWSAY